jgi:hypothetical protein
VVWGEQNTATTHPDLRPWDRLDQQAQQKDIDFVLGMPDVAGAAGMQIVRRRDLDDDPPAGAGSP